jgi:hypothetical protein
VRLAGFRFDHHAVEVAAMGAGEILCHLVFLTLPTRGLTGPANHLVAGLGDQQRLQRFRIGLLLGEPDRPGLGRSTTGMRLCAPRTIRSASSSRSISRDSHFATPKRQKFDSGGQLSAAETTQRIQPISTA